MIENTYPLVSVMVISYNSEKTIEETLDSIYDQTYKNIELVISDDSSTDNTVPICRKWIENHGDRFVEVTLLESANNRGIPFNYNKAESACTGIWIKNINADDYLLPDCISSFVNFVSVNPDAKFVFSGIKTIGGKERDRNYYESAFNERNREMNNMTVEQQYALVTHGSTPPAPCCFYNRQRAIELGVKSDERILSFEDWPKWIDVLKKGERFYFIDKELVVFRIGGISTSDTWKTMKSFKSRRQTYFYHIFDSEYRENPQKALDAVIEYECGLYESLRRESDYIEKITGGKLVKTLRSFLSPIFRNKKRNE